MATNHIISCSSPRFLTCARLSSSRYSTITNRITLCRRRRCQLQQHQRQSHPPSLPHDMPIIWARCHRQSHPVRAADPKYSLPRRKRAQGYQKYLDTMPAVSGCGGNGKRLTRVVPLLETAALFILLTLCLGPGRTKAFLPGCGSS
jgi:hypothetical protein